MHDYKTAKEILGLMPAGPEHYERDSRSRFQRYQEDPGNPVNKLLAFEELVAAFAIEFLDKDQNPNRKASVPLWVVRELTPGLVEYHNDLVPDRDDPNPEHDRDGPSLEQRLGIRPLKAGGHSEADKEETQQKRMDTALEVGYRRGPDGAPHGATEKAKNIVTEIRDVSSDYVKKAWGTHKYRVLHALKYYRVWERLNQGKKHP